MYRIILAFIDIVDVQCILTLAFSNTSARASKPGVIYTKYLATERFVLVVFAKILLKLLLS